MHIEQAVQNRIHAQLDEVCKNNNVRILLAVESGSRAWGFESADSDYDVRFIYVGKIQDYVRVDPLRDVIELPITDDLDINGWNIVKTLTLFRKSNPPLLEWLYSPIVYQENGNFASQLRAIASTSYSLRHMAHHYLSMTRQNYRTYILGREEVSRKKYLYALRPLAAVRWIFEQGTPPPTLLQATLSGIEMPQDVLSCLDGIIKIKRHSAEVGLAPHEMLLDEFIEADLARLNELLETLPHSHVDVAEINTLLWTELGMNAAS